MTKKILSTSGVLTGEELISFEIGACQLVCVARSKDKAKITAVEYFTWTEEEDFLQIWKDIFIQSSFLFKMDSKNIVNVIWINPEAIDIPSDFSEDIAAHWFGGQDILKMQNGDVTTYYTAEKKIKDCILYNFPNIKNYSKKAILREHFAKVRQAGVYMHYLYQSCILSLVKENGETIIKTIRYQSELDPVYHLLQLAKAFNINLDSLNVYVSGLIATESPLYETLTKFIPNIQKEDPDIQFFQDGTAIEFPKHFITPFIKYSI